MGKLKPHRRCLYELSAAEGGVAARFVSRRSRRKNHPRCLFHYRESSLPNSEAIRRLGRDEGGGAVAALITGVGGGRICGGAGPA